MILVQIDVLWKRVLIFKCKIQGNGLRILSWFQGRLWNLESITNVEFLYIGRFSAELVREMRILFCKESNREYFDNMLMSTEILINVISRTRARVANSSGPKQNHDVFRFGSVFKRMDLALVKTDHVVSQTDSDFNSRARFRFPI